MYGRPSGPAHFFFDDREFADGDETGAIAVMICHKILENCLRILQIYLLHEVNNVRHGPAGCNEAAAVGLLAWFT
jgi:hypothetical protein